VEAMSSVVWWVIEWLPKVRARNKCTVDFPPSPLPFFPRPTDHGRQLDCPLV
jgi:hypothetical protein